MTGKAITPATLLTVQHLHDKAAESKKKNANKPVHRLIPTSYEQASRTQAHPVRHLERRHTGWTCATIDIHFDEGWARNWPHSADLTIDLDDATIRKLIPADAPWTPPSISNATQLEVITSPHLWPRYPKLFLHRPGHEERGGEPRGHILDELRAVIHRGNEPALSYPDHRALYDAGWRIAGWPLEPTP